MKLERIALRGFLSHTETDLELNGARLATFVGPNGAGKSSLLDGVLYALFDAARGRTDDLVQLGQSDMSATVELEYSGSRYRVTRGRTTRSGGKSFLELAIAMGPTGPTTDPLETVSWRPLTGDTIRETQASIEQLLRMDAATFTTAAFLMQGQANRFTEATAGERKRILSTVLGLDRFERAEARARELARAAEALLGAGRDLLQRLDEQLADGKQHRSAAEYYAVELGRIDEQLETARAGRTLLEQQLRDLAAQLATIAAAEADVTRLEAELVAQMERWKRADAQRAAATSAIARHEAALDRAPAVELAAAALVDKRQAVIDLEGCQERHRAATEQLQAAKDRLAQEERAHEALVAEHGHQRSLLEATVRHLQTEHDGAQRVQCPKCRHGFPAVRDGLAGEVETARQALSALVEPKDDTYELRKLRAQVVRRESDLRDVGFDEATLRTARQELLGTERIAAEAPAIAAARQGLDDARRQLEDALGEQAAVTVAGQSARAALTQARERVATAEGLHNAETTAKAGLAAAGEAIVTLEQERTTTLSAKAKAEAQVEALERLQVQRDELDEKLAGDGLEAQRLRKLAGAFGPSGIPARIIESTVPELTTYANELLAQMRPEMSLSIRSQRAKKTGDGVIEALDLVVRDAAGERPLSMFSGGERMSVSLALAVGLSRLVARRAGSRIESLVIDEPDNLDVDARRAFGQALRVLAHHGELSRVLLVSHHADLAEYGDAIYQVSRNGHGSQVELVS